MCYNSADYYGVLQLDGIVFNSMKLDCFGLLSSTLCPVELFYVQKLQTPTICYIQCWHLVEHAAAKELIISLRRCVERGDSISMLCLWLVLLLPGDLKKSIDKECMYVLLYGCQVCECAGERRIVKLGNKCAVISSIFLSLPPPPSDLVIQPEVILLS